jgi:hypothetical protein
LWTLLNQAPRRCQKGGRSFCETVVGRESDRNQCIKDANSRADDDRRRRDAEAKRKNDADAKRKSDAEAARRKSDADARRKAEEDERRRRSDAENARRKSEDDARRKSDDDARRRNDWAKQEQFCATVPREAKLPPYVLFDSYRSPETALADRNLEVASIHAPFTRKIISAIP